MTLRYILTLALITLSSQLLAVEPVPRDKDYYAKHSEPFVYKNDEGDTMRYRVFTPADYDPQKKYPLVVALHGSSSRGSDNRGQLRVWVAGWMDPAVQEKHPCIILMPQCPSGDMWVKVSWGNGSQPFPDTPGTPTVMVRALVDKLLKEKTVDPSRIYVIGASMGGYGTWNFATQYPDLVAAAVPICGGGDPTKADNLVDIPIWAFHGDRDRIVLPSGSTDMVKAVKDAGGKNIRATIYEGVGHNSADKAWRDRDLIDWLFKQKKSAP